MASKAWNRCRCRNPQSTSRNSPKGTYPQAIRDARGIPAAWPAIAIKALLKERRKKKPELQSPAQLPGLRTRLQRTIGIKTKKILQLRQTIRQETTKITRCPSVRDPGSENQAELQPRSWRRVS